MKRNLAYILVGSVAAASVVVALAVANQDSDRTMGEPSMRPETPAPPVVDAGSRYEQYLATTKYTLDQAKGVFWDKQADPWLRNAAYNRLNGGEDIVVTASELIRAYTTESTEMRSFYIQYLQDICSKDNDGDDKAAIVEFWKSTYQKEKDPEIRSRILLSLGYMKPETSVALCADVLRHYRESSSAVSEAEMATAIEVMGMVRNDSEFEMIFSLADAAPAETVRVESIYALGEFGHRTEAVEKALGHAKASNSYRICNAAKLAMSKLKGPN
jgi:hypothetical protein